MSVAHIVMLILSFQKGHCVVRQKCYNSLGKYQIQSSQKRTVYPKDKLL